MGVSSPPTHHSTTSTDAIALPMTRTEALTPNQEHEGPDTLSEVPRMEKSAVSKDGEKHLTDHPNLDNSDIVGWDSDNDAQNPMNWSATRKWGNVALLSFLSFLTPFGSSAFAPGVPEIMAEFHSDSSLEATFVVSIYILGFAVGPLIVAPLSEMYGRVWIYNVTNILFLIFTIAAALSANMGQLIAFRLFMGIAGSASLAIGSGTIADTIPISQRARALSFWTLGPLLGPSIGPIVGGYLTQAAGWRWVFWLIAIVAGIACVACFVFFKETYAPKLLRQKAVRLRKETGNHRLRSPYEKNAISKWDRFKTGIVRPAKMFARPAVFLLTPYVAVAYGAQYLLFTTFVFVFQDRYHFSEQSTGLIFIAPAVGQILGNITFSQMADLFVRRRIESGQGAKPEHRLNPYMTIPGGILLSGGLFLYGWTVQFGFHWIVPLVGSALVGFGLIGVMLCIQTYLVDSYQEYAASVIAANVVLRSLAGGLLPLAGLKLYDALGYGWGNSLIGFITLVLVPVPWLFRVYGERLRAIILWKDDK
ncbi:major facilitator superfamily domain-containing protein [Xylariaceae sp. FL1651]|nr:major facilitator superfamily domain-containing protein [Xylariaceae sp. FL1651]